MDAATAAHDDASAGMGMGKGMGTDAGDSGLPPIDLTGLIATSGSQLVFSSQPIEDLGDYPPSQLYALDLKNGKTHDLGKAELSYTSVSQDQSILFVGGANAASDSNLFIVRLTDQGVVPATAVSGFKDRPGNEYAEGWTGDGRYAFFQRGSNIIGDGIDVVDTRTNSLLWYADTGLDDDIASVQVAPKGTWFGYWLGKNKRAASLGHIEHDDVKTTALSVTGSSFVFDDSGTHVAYTDDDATSGMTKLLVRTLGGTAAPIGEPDGYPAASISMFAPDGRVLSSVQTDASSANFVNELISTQGDAPVVLGDKTRNASWRVPSLDFSMMLFDYSTQDSQDLAFVDPAGKMPDIPVVSLAGDAAVEIRAVDDKRFIYEITAPVSAMSAEEVHLVRLDSSGKVVDTRLDMQDEVGSDCTDEFTHSPTTKLVFMDRKTWTLHLIDLRGDTPQRVAMLAPSLDGVNRMYCPMWGPNGDAFAYVELSDTSSRIRFVRWGDGAPETPDTAYEADAAVDVLVVRP